MPDTAQAVLPDVQTAYNNLFAGIHQKVFFQKCAASGFYPENQAQAQWMLETAGKLRHIEQVAPQLKEAGDQNDPYFAASQALDQVMAQYGLDGGVKQAAAQEADLAIKQAAADLSQDPTFYNSVMSLKAAEAAQIQDWIAQQRPAQDPHARALTR